MDSSRTISLSQGLVAIIDEADFALVAGFKWHAYRHRNTFYAITNVPLSANRGTTLKLHRLILGAPAGTPVDHRDGDGLNNRRQNLRLATHTDNLRNMHARRGESFKGVTLFKDTGHRNRPWGAHIRVDKKLIHLGCFKSDREAALAYDRAAREYFGEFAELNLAQS